MNSPDNDPIREAPSEPPLTAEVGWRAEQVELGSPELHLPPCSEPHSAPLIPHPLLLLYKLLCPLLKTLSLFPLAWFSFLLQAPQPDLLFQEALPDFPAIRLGQKPSRFPTPPRRSMSALPYSESPLLGHLQVLPTGQDSGGEAT